jgi:hypothetical protein
LGFEMAEQEQRQLEESYFAFVWLHL